MTKVSYKCWDHPDLIVAYDMDTLTADGKIKDMTGGGKDLTMTGSPTREHDIIPSSRARGGSCYRFDGSTQYAESDAFTAVNVAEWSVVAFINRDDQQSNGAIFYMDATNDSTLYTYFSASALTSGGSTPVYRGGPQGPTKWDTANKLHMVAGRWDGTTQTVKLYPNSDGWWKNTGSAPGDMVKICVGAYANTYASKFDGYISNILVFNRALTAAEVDAIWQSAQHVISTKRTHDGLSVWDGVADGLWENTAAWTNYWTGSVSKSVTPTDTGVNYMGQTGITDGRFFLGSWTYTTSFNPPRHGWNAIRCRLWLDGLPKHDGVVGRIIMRLAPRGSIGSTVNPTDIAIDGLTTGWNDIDVKMGEVTGGMPWPSPLTGPYFIWYLQNNTDHGTESITEVVIADLEFYKTEKIRYTFGSGEDLADWTHSIWGGAAVDPTITSGIKDGKLVSAPVSHGDAAGWWGNKYAHSVSLNGDFHIRAKVGRKPITPTGYRCVYVRAAVSGREASTPYFEGSYLLSNVWEFDATQNPYITPTDGEAYIGIIRRGGVTRGYVESGGYRRYSTNVESGHIGTDAITEVQIGVFFQTTGYDTDDELWISEVEWEEL